MPTSSGQWKRDLIDLKNRLQTYSTSDLKRAPDFLTYNKTLEIPFIYNRFLNQQKPTRTRLSVDRAVDRAPNRELGHFSRSTGRSTDLHPCACCACRSTGPVDRSPATAGGRPGRSIDLLLLLLLTCFAAAASFVFSRRLPRRSLDDPCQLSWQYPLSFQQWTLKTRDVFLVWILADIDILQNSLMKKKLDSFYETLKLNRNDGFEKFTN